MEPSVFIKRLQVNILLTIGGKLPGDSTNTIYLKKGIKRFYSHQPSIGALIEDGEVSLYEGKDVKWNEHKFGYDLASETGKLAGSKSMTLASVFCVRRFRK